MKTVKFSEIFEFQQKSHIKAGDGLISGAFSFFSSSPILSKYSNSAQFNEPSLIFGTGGNASVHICENPFSVSTDCLVAYLRPNTIRKFNIKFVYYYLFGSIWILEKGFKGAGLRHISKGYINNIDIPELPLEAQKEIVKILDRADTIRRKRKGALDLLDNYLKSVFIEMFGDPVTNPKKWKLMKLGEISESRLGKMRDKQYITGNYLEPYLGNSNVKWFHFDLSNLLEMDFNEQEKIKYSLNYDDLLICEGGEIGRCAIWKDQITGCYFQKALHRVRTNKSTIIPEYLQWVLWFYSKGNAFKESRSQATIAHLTGIKLKRLPIPVAEINLQNKFLEIVYKTESIKQKMLFQSQQLDTQFQALMQKYFFTN